MKWLFLVFICRSLTWAAIPIDGGWTPWSREATIDCCSYGGFAQYTRSCTNPSPENGGKACFGTDSRWERCSCDCELACDGVTAFCANETGSGAFCMCVYGKVYPTGVDPDTITYCVDPPMSASTVNGSEDYYDVMPSIHDDVEPFSSDTKLIINIVEFVVCGWVVAWCVATIIVCAVFGGHGSHRFIHLMEEATLIIVYILIGYFAMNVTSTEVLCKLVSALLHYVFMCTMTFFALEALFAYSMISGISTRDGIIHPAAINIIVGFGIPIIPFAVSFGTLYEHYGENGYHCWCDMSTAQAWAVFLPIVVLFFSGGILAEASGLGEHPKLPDADQEQIKWSTNTKETLIAVLLLSMFAYFI
uniref:Uncharacterized protein n=1 Tax=Plectus sambesii TaxID=2011161 RepID=A0A914UPP3_9BILA